MQHQRWVTAWCLCNSRFASGGSPLLRVVLPSAFASVVILSLSAYSPLHSGRCFRISLHLASSRRRSPCFTSWYRLLGGSWVQFESVGSGGWQ